MEPAQIPGHGSVPAPVARQWIRDADEGSVWLRRLYTSPDGRDLVAMDSRRRVFTGLLRRLLVLRDDRCTTPWCDGAIVHADHTRPVRDGGPTDLANGGGKCARCNYVKEAPGWLIRVIRPGAQRELEVTTPLGRRYRSTAPPLLGWGWRSRADPMTSNEAMDAGGAEDVGRSTARSPDSTHGGAALGGPGAGDHGSVTQCPAVRSVTQGLADQSVGDAGSGRPELGDVEPRDDATGSVLERFLAGLGPAA